MGIITTRHIKEHQKERADSRSRDRSTYSSSATYNRDLAFDDAPHATRPPLISANPEAPAETLMARCYPFE